MEFTHFNSSINPSFWIKYTDLKLDIDKLNETCRSIWGYYTNVSVLPKSLLEVDSTSFNRELNVQNTYLPAHGTLLNKNTIEEFKAVNKTKVLQLEGNKMWSFIENGDAAKNPSLLSTFFILSYVDLKKYHYYYWFAFPTAANINYQLLKACKIGDSFDSNQLQQLYNNYNSLDLMQKVFFVVIKSEKSIELCTFMDYINSSNIAIGNVYFAFSDSSTNEKPSQLLKNFLLLVLHHCDVGSSIKVLSLRLGLEQYNYTCKNSVIFHVEMPKLTESIKNLVYNVEEGAWIGWERNERGKLGPKMCNMKNSMDPKCLAESAVDLNLKLMKWRLLPQINLERIKTTKCLLLGSGTLGCAVARNLLAWGVRHISFVDNSTVSYSNPVRQNLFTFEDCTKNSWKAEAAATNLKAIFPGVESSGYQINIPMPGHPIGDSLLEQTKENVDKLIKLISAHDAIFLLMDSRESRWLPTLLGSFHQKIVINAALGFDTFLVMRHGCNLKNVPNALPEPPSGIISIPGNNLGCYFCNDITAPGNSMKDRTLDQQCTVTRPGISNVAAALSVELLVSILQHEHGACAPAYYHLGSNKVDVEDIPSESLLGIVPHSIRGFLSTFTQVLPATKKYDQCTACSNHVLNGYESGGFEFLLSAFNDSKFLEALTGLDKLQTEDIDVWDLSDDDDDDE